ncbi:hypothetical protein VIBRN418_02561 [Vibrio sp. N418]|nr:hypothetical protein VIBRN418_02561 [Vibrio sp. N418]
MEAFLFSGLSYNLDSFWIMATQEQVKQQLAHS